MERSIIDGSAHGSNSGASASLFDQICSYDNILQAAVSIKYDSNAVDPRTKRIVRWMKTRDVHICRLGELLYTEKWRPGPLKSFTVYEPKRRDIDAPTYIDSVVHHAIHRILNPIFERRYIYHSYACRKDKGTHRAMERVQRKVHNFYMRYEDPYVVKCDISKYFQSIDHEVCLNILANTIGNDPPLLRLLYRLLTEYSHETGKGMPVGALTSQLIGNAYLDWMDHEITDYHGVPTYFRYMDDTVTICANKSEAQHIFDLMEYYATQLKLKLNPKSCIFPLRRGVDYVGYRIFPNVVKPRKRTIKNMRRKLNKVDGVLTDKLNHQVASFYGYTQNCNCYETIYYMADQYPVMLQTNIGQKVLAQI